MPAAPSGEQVGRVSLGREAHDAGHVRLEAVQRQAADVAVGLQAQACRRGRHDAAHVGREQVARQGQYVRPSDVGFEPGMEPAAPPRREGVPVEGGFGRQSRVGRGQGQAGQRQPQRVEADAAGGAVDGKAAFLAEGELAEVDRQASGGVIAQRVNVQAEAVDGNVVRVEALSQADSLRHVVSGTRAVEREAAHGIVAAPRVESSAAQRHAT